MSHNPTSRVLGAAVAGLVGIAGFATSASAQTATLDKNLTVSGQGSSFMSNFVEQCKADVKNAFGINITYQPTGSGAGRSAYLSGTNDFAGSDVPFASSESAKAAAKPYAYVPIAIGGVAVMYKLPGITDLKLSAPTLAKIFSGSITKWNDDAIAKDNPGLSLPDEIVKVVVRSDSSGTSNVFSDYLASASKGVWTKGAVSTFPVPAGNGIAQKGSDGVANYVAGDQGKGAITYAESSFAEERKLAVVKVINSSGNAVLPTSENVSSAMGAAAANEDGTLLLNFNAPAANAYPISTTAYLIVPQKMDPAKGDVLRTFLTYSLTTCQSKAAKLGYAPIPKSLEKLGLDAVAKINPGAAPVPTVPGAAAETATTKATPVTTAKAAATTKAPATTKKTTKKTAKKTAKKK